ncbi:MAG: HAD-IB family hydrolase [archaeon]|nr:HAD-IB family hydrolase [archaeon]
MGNIAAFYDIDGTLYREALSVELFKKLSKNGIVSDYKWYNEVKPLYDKWVNREANYDDYIDKLSKVYHECIVGVDEGVIKFLAKQVIEEKCEKLFRHTKNRLQWHKEQGHKVIIISGSSYDLASGLGKKLGVDDVAGTVFITDPETHEYTGKVIPMWDRESKINALNKFVEKYDIDLNESYAYGDTNGDFTMLNAVKYPTMINPTKELINHVKETPELAERITTIVERKDVIYKININDVEFFEY